MNNNALRKANEWAENTYFDEADRKEIKQLIANNDSQEINERFYKDLEFGTGGIRNILGIGSNRVNKYNIRRASEALAREVVAKATGDKKIAISYDNRTFSKEFAMESACVFAGHGIQALIYETLNPVCLLSFAIRHHQASAGVMVTASHNPPEYNGFKVYWSDGAQVTPPNDQNIISKYAEIKDYQSIKYIDFEEGIASNKIIWIGKIEEDAYFKMLEDYVIQPELCKTRGTELKLVYTPIHGTGLVPCSRVLDQMGLSNYHVVKEQAQPDKDFPTVESPNPENPMAMKLAVELMKSISADLAFGTDPDTDRLGVVLMHENEPYFLNGNQIGILMLHYMLTQLKEQGQMPDNPYFVKTIVTTPLQEVIAKHFDVEVENTLTGFKWICGRMKEIEDTQPNRNFLFGTEESFGYLNHEHIRDKDGVSSVALMAEVALWYKTQGLNLIQALDKIYDQFGFSYEDLLCLNYYGKEGADKISSIMQSFRNSSEKEICGETITLREDYNINEVVNYEDNSKKKLNLPISNVLGYHFASGNRLYLRPSGTEPKIKFYIMIQEVDGNLDEKKRNAKNKANDFLAYIDSRSKEA